MSEGIDAKMDKLIEKMSDGREDQLAEVLAMRKVIKNAQVKKNFKEHPAMKMLLDLLHKRDQAYTMILSNKEDLTDTQREGFFQRRKEVRFILSFFEVEKTIDSMEAQLDYQLGDEISTGPGNADA